MVIKMTIPTPAVHLAAANATLKRRSTLMCQFEPAQLGGFFVCHVVGHQ